MADLTPSSEDVRIYEVCVLYPYPLTQKEESETLKEVEGIFGEVGAKLVTKDPWGRRGLAYPVEGYQEGNYVIYYWEMEPAKVQEVDHALRISKRVLRHLVIKPPKGYQIVKYSEAYEEWLKTRESVEETRAREREEKLQAQVAEKAKRQAAKTTTRKKPAETEEKEAMGEEELSQKLEKLISDDSLDI